MLNFWSGSRYKSSREVDTDQTERTGIDYFGRILIAIQVYTERRRSLASVEPVSISSTFKHISRDV